MTRILGSILISAFVLLTLTLIGCGLGSDYPADVQAALEKAGANRGELERVLDHYADSDDTLGYQSALFLIGNMDGHSYATYRLVDTSDQTVELNVLSYPDYPALLEDLEEIEKERGELDYARDSIYEDLNEITADLLIEHIDQAVEVWQTKTWARDLPFEVFRDYVLPYRGSNEPLESWRPHFRNEFEAAADSLKAGPLEIASFINSAIMSWFKFDERFYLHPTDQGLAEMQNTKMGRCEDMTNLTIFALRANGIAVTSDYTPYWANTGNNHAWNAVVLADGDAVPFMGAEANPGKYKLRNKLGKAYRKTFGKNPDNLIFQEHKQEKIPRWLAGKNFTDVTSAYVDIADVTVEFGEAVPDSVDIAYLCVFNSGAWKPIHWGRVKDNQAVFTEMGCDVVYLPALYLNEEVVPWGAPFILHVDGSTSDLTPVPDETGSHEFSSTTLKTLAVSTDGIKVADLKSGDEYELSYYDTDWQSLGKAKVVRGSLIFENVPANALYWMVKADGRKDERIFTMDDGGQHWW